MHKEVLRSIENIGMFPVSAFVLFFLVFCLILFWVITYDKKTIQKLSALPLEGQHHEEIKKTTAHEKK